MIEKKNNTDVVSLLDRLAAVFRFVQQPCTNDINAEFNDVRVASADAFSEVRILCSLMPHKQLFLLDLKLELN